MKNYQFIVICGIFSAITGCGGGGSSNSENASSTPPANCSGTSCSSNNSGAGNLPVNPINPTPNTPTCSSEQFLENGVCQNKLNQQITGLSLPATLKVNQIANLTATTTANLPILYTTLTPDNCLINELTNQVRPIGIGVCKVQAEQFGDTRTISAKPVTATTLVLPVLTATGLNRCGTEDQNNLICSAINLGSFFGLNQDGEVKAGKALDYTSLVQNGSECILDNSTGLTWEQKSLATGTRNSNYRDDWSSRLQYVAALNNQKYCGYSDWRIPSRVELLSIIDYSNSTPALNPIFKNSEFIQWYWTSTQVSGNSGYAWSVDFNDGVSEQQPKEYLGHFRAVR